MTLTEAVKFLNGIAWGALDADSAGRHRHLSQLAGELPAIP